jgi:RNA polymerase sigma-70 factor (ECF subfamily)
MTTPAHHGVEPSRTAEVVTTARFRRQGQEAADEALIRSMYAEHGRTMLAYATRMLGGDRAAAEDVVQEALLRAWRNAGVLTNGRGSVRGWLLTVVHNLVVDRVRARSARPAEVIGAPFRHPMSRDHGDRVVDSMVVLDAIGRLSLEHREVLVEVHFRQRSVAETAEKLGLPAGTVKSRTFYAMQALRQLLAHLMEPDELEMAG